MRGQPCPCRLGDMRFAVVVLSLSALALAGPGCAHRNRWPMAMYGLSLQRPHVFRQPNGTSVPCGMGLAWLFGDLLWTCAIDRRATIQGNDVPAGATVWFRGDGTLEQVRYFESAGAVVPGEECRARRLMSFDQAGRLVGITVECFKEKTARP